MTRIIGYSVQMVNNEAMIEHAVPMLEAGLQDHARENGLIVIGDERERRTVYGSLVETGEVIRDDDDTYQELIWGDRDKSVARYARVTLEARAEVAR